MDKKELLKIIDLKLLASITLAILLASSSGFAQLRPALIFGDHAVLQRNIEVPVWGTADRGDRIVVSFQGNEYSAKVGRSKKWQIKLPAMPAGGPYEMTIRGKSDKITLKNIMIGDVWVCSGQSNMEWKLQSTDGAKEEIAAANFKNIREFKIPTSSSMIPEDQLAGGSWSECTPETAGNFTAVGYYFAKTIATDNNVTVGLLNTSWGGSRIEPWMSAEALGFKNVAEAQKNIQKKRELDKAKMIADLKAQIKEMPLEEKAIVDKDTLWSKSDWKDDNWERMVLPGIWELRGFDALDGVVWYRKSIELSQNQIQEDASLYLGPIDDTDHTWINGHYVGGLENSYDVPRKYNVAKQYLQSGKNVIAIRVDDTGGGGGLSGKPDDLYLETSVKKIPLSGEWKYKIGKVYLESQFSDNHVPTLLYNKMVHPILNFPIKGVTWYQGESNAENHEDAYKYRNLFSDMIKSWRKNWGNREFPFLFVQLANFMEPSDKPDDGTWAILRESQSDALKLPNTGQAVIIDLGESKNIHPGNKRDVGYRLALAAQKIAYNKDLVYSGPVYKSMTKDNNRIILSFDHVGSGLLAKDKYGYLRGFAIAGKDKKFVWAKAKIEGNKVVVYSENVKNPTAVRYAWGNNPDDANLYNKEGIPASPFRTDRTVH